MVIPLATWQKIEPLLTTALDLEPPDRAAWLDGVASTHPDIAPLLARMVAAHDRAELEHALETVPRLADAPPSEFSTNDRVGPFLLRVAIGRGGMGEVWLADQADGRLARQVALKLPRTIDASDVRAERFRRERDILARLVHPNIARLYDAGVSDAGRPYLAMEYVDGRPLDEYVAAHKLDLAGRLALFRQVLGAVAHAHRHLVVHRDLKPANILVDAAGQVKLLDFGIAKLIDDEAAPGPRALRDLTRVGGRVMTIRYAAPEQVAEGTITTATDTYALGVILHELVTGQSPYRALREERRLAQVALLEEEIQPPSSLAPVAADLDAIVLKALRREPGERYATVDLFDEDIARFLEHRPVRARAGTWRYLAGRFLRRHRLPMALAAAVLVTLAAGLVVAESQRRVAVAERERAQRHFASVRKLANAFLFDVHGEIEHLPGALKAREMLVKTSLSYLDALLAEAADDPALLYEMATAYHKIGQIQGEPGGNNIGDPLAGIANFEKGKAIFARLDAMRPDDVETVREHRALRYALARAYYLQSDARWAAEIASTVALAERVATLPGAIPRDRAVVPAMRLEQAYLARVTGDLDPRHDATAREAIAMEEALARELPLDPNPRQVLAAGYGQAAGIVHYGGPKDPERARRAIDYRRKAVAAIRTVIADKPDQERFRKQETEALLALSGQLADAGEWRESRALLDDVSARLRARRKADPGNVDLAWDHIGALVQTMLLAFRMGEPARGIAPGREAQAVVATVPEASRGTRDGRSALATLQGYLAVSLIATAPDAGRDRPRRLAMLVEARGHLLDVMRYFEWARAEKMRMVDSEVAEVAAALALCEAEIPRLRAAGS